MKKKIILAAALLLAVVVAFWIFHKPADTSGKPGGFSKQNAKGSGGKPLPVQAALANGGDIDVFIDALGTVTARNTATVKTRVDGQLDRILFRDGQMVKQGEALAEIDPRPFQVVLDQAKGQLARDQAQLAGAKHDLDRYRDLLAKDSIAKQQVDDQEAQVLQYEGTVLTDRAQVESAQLNLDFTHIKAPLSGRLGIRQVDAGNMIHGTDSNGIVVITQIQPIYVIFSIPSDKISAVLVHLHAGKTLAVDAVDRDGKTRLATGKLLTVDNQIDTTTGTVKLKAEFANGDEKLFPNQFVNARLRVETMHDAVLVPVAAIQRGTQGTFVYVVGQDQAVSIRPVTLGPISGEIVAIGKGLAAGEQVVTDGADKLHEGVTVEVTTPGANITPGKGPHSTSGSDSGPESGSPEEKQKRWAELDARIDRGEFGEEIKKLPEEQRKLRMREMRKQREGGASQGSQ